MANRTYANFWTRDHSEATIIERFKRLLETVPRSASRSGFASLVIRAVSPAEAPVAEHDLRGVTLGPADVIELAREHLEADVAYEVEAYWDLWQRDADVGGWQRLPERLLLTFTGNMFDDGAAIKDGDFIADVGLEHLYTGHARLLGVNGARSAPSDPVEAEFLAVMTHEEDLHEYYEKTRLNIEQLLGWVRAVEQAVPLETYRLSSEGEDNFEARLDEILAAR